MSEEKSVKPDDADQNDEQVVKKSKFKSKKFIIITSIILAMLLIIPSLYAVYVYAATPQVVRSPAFEHYHFRMQVVVDGQTENFGAEPYQEPYSKDLCTADLTESPIHFHDNMDQFVHIHWANMTGGLVMKHYGWNFIGGPDDILGYKTDEFPTVKKIDIQGKLLPSAPTGSNYYVYVGDEKGYQEKSFDDWLNQTHEEFFGVQSNVPKLDGTESSFIERLLLPSVSAHGGVDDGHPDEETEEQKLTRINNLLGNVVIFVQKDAPTEEQIKERFNNLVPLSESTCGG